MPRPHLIFDLDDTLYPERAHALAGFGAAAAWAEAELGIAGLAGDLIGYLDAGHLGRSFALALAARRPEHTEAELAALVRAWRLHEPASLELFEDARRLLERLAGQRIGLITDGSAAIQAGKVRALGLAPRFHQIIYTGALGPDRAFHKPHPRAYELMEAAFVPPAGAPIPRFVYIGDNPSKDFVTPNARGWTSIMIVRPEHAEHRIHKAAPVADGGAPHMTLASLDDLPEDLLPI